MTAAVGDLFKSLEEARSLGTLTVDQTKEARSAFDKMWTDFQSSAAEAGLVGQQGLDTMKPFIESWSSWLGDLETAAKELERAKAIKDITDRVTNAADGFEIMDAAIQQLLDSGTDSSAVIHFLGSDVESLAERMQALGIEIPPTMQSILDQMEATEELEKAAKAAAEAEREHANAVKSTVDKVTNAADGAGVLMEALQQLQDQGVPASAIVHFLGNDIENMAERMRALGIEIPPTMQSLLDQITATSELEKAAKAAAEAERAHAEAVQSTIDKVTNAAAGAGILEEALRELQSQGVPASQIIAFLGSDISRMAETLRDMNAEIPAAIESFYLMIEAQKRIKEIDKELEDTVSQLADTVIRKMDLLDSQIQKHEQNIDKWKDSISDLDDDIKKQSAHLKDAAYWQREYDSAIKDSAQALESITQQRQSLERQIADLTIQVERDRLQAALEGASGEQAKLRAQQDLDTFERGLKEQEVVDRRKQLEDLRSELAVTIEKQAEAEEAYAQASVAAQKAIEDAKEEVRQRIILAETRRTEFQENIALERQRIAVLEDERRATTELMAVLGIARVDEMTKLNNTISALQERSNALQRERDLLREVAALSNTATGRVQTGSGGGSTGGSTGSTGGTGGATGTGGTQWSDVTARFPFGYARDDGKAMESSTRFRLRNADGAEFTVTPGNVQEFLRNALSQSLNIVGAFHNGGISEREGLAWVDRNELHIPERQWRNSAPNQSQSMQVTFTMGDVYIEGDADEGIEQRLEEVIVRTIHRELPEVLPELLQTNRGNIRVRTRQ